MRAAGRRLYLEPDDPRIGSTYGQVGLEEAGGAFAGQCVVAEIVRYPERDGGELPARVGHILGEPADPRFIGKIWISTTQGHARGSMLIFLPDRSLLMDSCFETYRISKWGAEGDRIRWIEDAIPIEATLSMPNEDELRLQVAGQDRVQSYVTATVPYVCPDMPR